MTPYQIIQDYIGSHRYRNEVTIATGGFKSDEYRASRKLRRTEEGKLNKVFKDDLFEAYGLTTHPKREKAFEIAWDWGHSAGLQEVLGYFDSLADLMECEHEPARAN